MNYLNDLNSEANSCAIHLTRMVANVLSRFPTRSLISTRVHARSFQATLAAHRFTFATKSRLLNLLCVCARILVPIFYDALIRNEAAPKLMQ